MVEGVLADGIYFFFLKWRRQGAFLSKEGGDEVEALRV